MVLNGLGLALGTAAFESQPSQRAKDVQSADSWTHLDRTLGRIYRVSSQRVILKTH